MIHAAILLAVLTGSAGAGRGDLAGKVVGAAEKPLSQATVFVYTAKPRVGLGVLCPSCYVDCGKKATTDAEGKFFISRLDPSLLFRVLVVADGYRPQFAQNVDPLQDPLHIKLEAMPNDLSGRAVLRGRVLDPACKPVVGAVVSPMGCERVDRRWWGSMPGVDPASVTTLRGEFLITGNPGDLGYDLEVDARGFAKRRVDLLPTGDKIHEIRLTEGAAVHGRILKEGQPVAGIAVGLVQCDLSHRSFVGPYQIATDNEGRFTFVNVHPNDEYFVFTAMTEAVRFGGILPLERLVVEGDATSKDTGNLNLTSTFYRLSGRVILADGKVVPDSSRLILLRKTGWDSQTAVLADDGSFTFTGTPEEALTLSARIPGYRLASERNRFQQVESSTVAMFVDADKSDLELFFKPEPTRPPASQNK